MRRPWRAAEDEAAEQEAAAAVIDLRGSAFMSRAAAWAQIGRYAAMVLISVGLVAIAAYTFGEWGDRVAPTAPTVAAVSPTPAPVTVTTPASQPAVSVAATKATAPATTSTSPPTTLYVQPVGEAIPINDLRLTIYGIGDLRIGDPEGEVSGVLAATFGQPDAEAPVEPGLAHPGACPGTATRVLRWGILEITLSNNQFVGYRVDQSLGDTGVGTAALRTVSGLQVGATVSTLETIYRGSYAVVVRDAPERGPSFSLQRYSGEELFWGPVTSVDNSGEVLGIYSPTNCR